MHLEIFNPFELPRRVIDGKMTCIASIWIAVLLCGFCVAKAQEASSPYVAPGRELIVGVKEAPPFAMKDADGKWSGVSVDLWSQVAEQLHLKFRFLEEPTIQKLLEEAAAGKIDVAVGAIMT
jgi:ABC-type amino acid transport substrate-binding protein